MDDPSREDLCEGKMIPLPFLPVTPRQEQQVAFRSPRHLGDRVVDPKSTAVQRRLRLIESKSISTHVNPIAAWPSTGFKAVHAITTRPPLSVELENYVRKEQRNLMLSKPDATRADGFPIFREAFGCIINHFPEYHSVLSLIKSEYDQTVVELSAVSQRVAKIELENKSMKGTHMMQLHQEREQMQACLSEAQTQLAAALRANQIQRQHIAKLEHDHVLLSHQSEQRQRDYDESQERIRVLSVTLVEEATKMAKTTTNYHKAQSEIERLNHLVQSLRQLVAEAERTIQAFRMAPMGGEGDAPSGGSRYLPSFRRAKLSQPKSQAQNVVNEPSAISDNDVTPLPQVAHRRSSRTQAHFSPSGSCSDPSPSPRSGNYTTDEIEALREKIFDLECKIESTEHQLTQHKSENKRLQNKVVQLQHQTGRDTLTPRPDWASVKRRLPACPLDNDRTSDEKASDLAAFLGERVQNEVLANERKALGEIVWNWMNDSDLSEADLLHRYRYFVPRGTASSVPKYLQSSRPVRNRQLKQSDVEVLLNQFWTSRFAQRRSVPFPALDDSWMEWGTKQSGSSAAAVELSYNIFDACERFQIQDPNCKLFLKVMRGDLCELVVSDLRQSIAALSDLCLQLRQSGNTVCMSKQNFFKAVRIVFPGKHRDHMDKLRLALALAAPHETFDFRELFSDSCEKPALRRVMELLRKQHMDEIELFTVEVCEAIRALAEDGRVCVADAMNTVLDLDPATVESDVHQTFSVACRLTLPDLLNADRSMTMEVEPMVQRLRLQIVLKRAGPAEDDGEMDDDDGNV